MEEKRIFVRVGLWLQMNEHALKSMIESKDYRIGYIEAAILRDNGHLVFGNTYIPAGVIQEYNNEYSTNVEYPENDDLNIY